MSNIGSHLKKNQPAYFILFWYDSNSPPLGVKGDLWGAGGVGGLAKSSPILEKPRF